ncbi:unnamed protein product [Knipowitschia caucasica]|uniref:Uncharacterized protein n=1 Tax=Knipowitschia caucasica TaxID=637954 RepID=A0AAV2MEP5_KNICA
MHPAGTGLLLALLCAVAFADRNPDLDEHWKLWKNKYQRNYHNKVEEESRRALWEKNLWFINTHNLEASMGLHSYTVAMNQMGDLSTEEALQMYASLRIPEDLERPPSSFIDTDSSKLPLSVDWRKLGAVTNVKDQGRCGSCWAFSVVGAMEGHLFRTTGRLVDLSPQQLVSCCTDGNFGCQGGFMHKGFQCIIRRGLESEANYPYRGMNDVCRYNPQYVAANCSAFSFVPREETELQKAVATIGPISVGIYATPLIYYSSGIFSGPCAGQMNHGVVVVGYGTESGQDYWLVKNSWSSRWGEQGYFRLARNRGNLCGVASYATYCDI